MTKKTPDFTSAYLRNSHPNKTHNTRLGRAIAPKTQAHPDYSGVHPLADSLDAFAARYLLAEMAEQTLDVQYYIWEDDMSGRLLFSALLDAAKRGVWVRLLLDDNNTLGMDSALRLLNSHPNIEVRLFNPFSFRTLRALGYLTDFARLNRRMHNKSYTVDGEATIIGGRNVGDAYFGAGDQPLFSDLDVLAVGPVVKHVSDDFERYWECASVSTLEKVLDVNEHEIEQRVQLPQEWQQDPVAQSYLDKLATTQFATHLDAGTLSMIWAKTRLLSDDPRKGEGKARRHSLLPLRLLNVIGEPTKQLDIISSYFVPTRAGVAQLLMLKRKGVNIAILTNSLAANDVAVVHAGYARWRKKLLRHGIALYELKPGPQKERVQHDRGLTGNSGSSLHAKTFSVDGNHVFIGSFNFDPRSAMLNTEMGLVIESQKLAQQIHTRFTQSQQEAAWTLRLDRTGRLNWIEQRDGKEVVLTREPQTRFWQRVLVTLAYWLPVEWLL
ncbi:phospholipase D family protein [Atlantibacter subterranea]|uniref:phospholipase D family protein n=1 Tax=Atlantibacter subterraneus TaxID=255519 RepID=UPI001183EFD3|nr:phospholipase D family protein [Atlantibacter subterranea]TSJ59302.1 phospholipase D family protein [Atlantibacter subterranea]